MRSWCSSFTAGLALLFVFLPSPARVAMTDLDLSSQVQDIMAENFAPVVTANDAGGLASAVYVAGHVQFFNYGLADQAGKRPITPDTLFNIASVRRCLRLHWSRSERCAAK
jgi:beta-lactamase class C